MRDNGLTAAAYTSMGGIDPRVAQPVLAALAEAGIAAYHRPPAHPEATSSIGPVAGPTGQPGATAPGSAAGQAGSSGQPGAAAPAGSAAQSGASAEGEAGEASSPAKPSGAEGDATADTSAGADDTADTEAPTAASTEVGTPAPAEADTSAAEAGLPAPTKADEAERVKIPAGFDEIFVDAGSEERARAVIARSTEDAEWKSLVEQFNAPSAEGHDATPVPRWPASEDVDENSYEPLIDVPAGLVVGDTDEEPPEEPPARRADDPHDHFVPPEPPKGPRLDWISRLAWLGLIGGPALLILAAMLDFGTGRTTTVAVVGFIGGFLTLVYRMNDRLPQDDTPDDGAIV